MARRTRIDILLVERGLAESRSFAQRLLMAGQVRVDDQVVLKPSRKYQSNVSISVDTGPRFVSRGGEKLLAALETFDIDVSQWVCADVGASTGGFTDCLLQHGASKVYAIDVGHGQLHWRLRNHPRVIVMERQNARYLEELDEQVHLATVDVSFISLSLVLPSVVKWLRRDGQIIALIKPQFEAGREFVGKRGVVRDAEVHRKVLEDVLSVAKNLGLYPRGLLRSPILGPKGNVEFFVWCLRQGSGLGIDGLITSVLPSEDPNLSK